MTDKLEIKEVADAGSSRYPGILQYITYHGHGKFMCRHPVCVKVSRLVIQRQGGEERKKTYHDR